MVNDMPFVLQHPAADRARRATRLCLLVVLSTASAALPAAAQQGPLVVFQRPSEWETGRRLRIAEGERLVVEGSVSHAAGIDSIRIGDARAEVRPEPGTTDLFNFSRTLTLARGTSSVTMVVFPRGAAPVPRAYPVEVVAPGVAGGPPAEPVSSSGAGERTGVAAGQLNPGGAAVRSLLVPGLGQFYTRRPVVGVALLAGAAASLAVGLGSTRETVECLAYTAGDACPENARGTTSSTKPYMAAGLGGVAALAILGAFDAHRAAKRANERRTAGGLGRAEPRGLRFREPAAYVGTGGAGLVLLRAEF